jgi:choline transport protein
MMVGNVDEILATPTGQPFIQVFYNVTQSKAATNAMTSIMIIMSTFGCVTSIATSSRQIWAFARDRGLPFSTWLAHVSNGFRQLI